MPILVAIVAALGSVSALAQDYSTYSGADLFKRFCASCHGAAGTGDGPVAATLRVQVPDLTRLVRREGAAFPADQVRRIIDGREIRAAHGARRMPVWGYEFSAATPGETSMLIDRLVEYLRTIQRPRPSADAAPAQLPVSAGAGKS